MSPLMRSWRHNGKHESMVWCGSHCVVGPKPGPPGWLIGQTVRNGGQQEARASAKPGRVRAGPCTLTVLQTIHYPTKIQS
jgi:hypothetical protein